MENVTHIGSLWTCTDFRLKDGSQIRIKVSTRTNCTVSNASTSYYGYVFTKGFRCRNWAYGYAIESPLDDRLFEHLTNDQVYAAYYNHWQKLNPIRLFASRQYNSELKNFSVKERTQTRHFCY